MKQIGIRPVSFGKTAQYASKDEFQAALPHLSKEEIDYYFPQVSKPAETSPDTAKNPLKKKEPATPGDEPK